MARGAAASSDTAAAHAACQALAQVSGEGPATAVDALVAGVLAIATRHPAVLLSGCSVLLGGTGEGLRAIDGRARQPGLGAQRPRGFHDASEVPDVARVGAPGLPAALALAHAGRGGRPLAQLARLAVEALSAEGAAIDPHRAEAVRTFGREAASWLRAGVLREALLAATPRSRGGMLTGDDLDAVRPALVDPLQIAVGARRFSLAPWAEEVRGMLDGQPRIAIDAGSSIEIVAAADGLGAFAIAAVPVAARALPVEGTGLAAPLIAQPVMRGVTRLSPGAPLSCVAPIALGTDARGERAGHVDLAVGERGGEDIMGRFVALLRRLGEPQTAPELPRATGVLLDVQGNAHALRPG